MDPSVALAAFFIVGILAGLIGSLTGLGGGIIVIPALSLLFHVPLHQAMAAGLIATMTTSSGASVAFLREGFTNLRVGMLLEMGTVTGALVGAWLVAYTSIHLLQLLFGSCLLFSAVTSVKRQESTAAQLPSDPLALRLKLLPDFAANPRLKPYAICRLKAGFFVMIIAGLLSGLLGIGSGTLKMVAMDQLMKLPYKVATATSNFIIGITATAGIGIYWARGYVAETSSVPVMLGVLAGSILGARLLMKINTKWLRYLFMLVVLGVGLQMIYKGGMGLFLQ